MSGNEKLFRGIAWSDVRRLIDYDPRTGVLRWNRREEVDSDAKRFNVRWAGKEAFTAKTPQGYSQGTILQKHCEAHRLIWFWMTGQQPASIDHINGDKADNRWSNLRAVTHKDNMRNTKRPSHNTSGVMGVSYCRTHKKWLAVIQLHKGRRRVAYRKTKDEAILMRKRFEMEEGFHPNHGRVGG